MATLHYSFNQEGGVTSHRVVQPVRFCHPDFAPLGYSLQFGAYLPDEAEWIGVHGLPAFESLIEIAKRKRRGQKLLWSLDDDFLSVPEWSPVKVGEDGLAAWYILKEIADHIVVSTPALAKTIFDGFSPKVTIAPNLIDPSQFIPWERMPDNEPIDRAARLPVKVMWCGGVTHRRDVDVLVQPLLRLLERFPPNQMQVVWFGPTPPTELLREHLGRGLYWHTLVPYQNYQVTLNALRPDVYLCPLDKCAFNESKSALRVMEGWAAQAVPVATPHGEYNCVRHAEDGFRADSVDEWEYYVGQLVTEHAMRLEMAERGRRRLEAEFNWNSWNCRLPWLILYSRLFGCKTPGI